MLPSPLFASPSEDYPASLPETDCDPTPKPGVEMFRDFVVSHLGGNPGSIARPCNGQPSGHYAGRAWDWGMHFDNPDEAARVQELFDWLLANNDELARRAGVIYMIWANKVWRARTGAWEPYDGYDEHGQCPSPPCRHPHTDHVHFSFSVAGADGETSFYDWLRGDQEELRELTGAKTPAGSTSPWFALVGCAIGFVGAVATKQMLRRATR